MSSSFRRFLSERFGLGAGGAAPGALPGGPRWGRSLGWALAALVALEFATGWALMSVYSPSVQGAWASIVFLEHRVPWGALVRATHHWAGQMLLVLLVAHALRVVYARAYARPREGTFWLGMALAGLGLALVHTGTILPWDQRAYWILRVEAGYALGAPGGAAVAQQLQGGAQPGALALTRMYALHAGLLPLLFVGALAAHFALRRRHGRANPNTAERVEAPRDGAAERWSQQALRDGLVALGTVALAYFLARRFGAPLDAPADPEAQYPARPEWFLLGLFRLRKWFEGPWELAPLTVLPALAGGYFALLPLLDRGATGRRSLVLRAGAAAIVLAFAALTGLAVRADVRDASYRSARAAADRDAQRAVALAIRGVPPEGPQELLRNDPLARPAALYATHCGSCHASADAPARDARGQRTNARGPALEGFGSRGWAEAVLRNPDDDALFGRTEIHDMPSQLRRLGEDGVRAVAEYLHAQGVEPGEPPADAALVERGQALYYQRCTTCHLGPRDPAASEEDLEALADADAPDLTGWGSRAWLRRQITTPAAPAHYGARNAMPAFAEELSAADLEYVVSHVRSLRTRPAPVVSAPPERPRS